MIGLESRPYLYGLLQRSDGIVILLPVEADQPFEAETITLFGKILYQTVSNCVSAIHLGLLQVKQTKLVMRRHLVLIELKYLFI